MKIENSNLPRLVDVHTHVQFAAFNNDSKEVIDRALAEDVWLINVGTQKDTSRKAVELASRYQEGIYATIGLHPIHTVKSYHDSQELGEGGSEFVSRGEEFNPEFYKKLGENKKVVAIGECGLDYYRLDPETQKQQEEVFIKQIELASQIRKPLMIHCRGAFPDLIKILKNKRHLLLSPAGIVHFMSGTKEDALELMDLGFYFSFGGVITFARDYDEVIKYIGLDRLLVETDAPYVAPAPVRGKRNEPGFIVYTIVKLAEILGVSPEEGEQETTQNARSVFKI